MTGQRHQALREPQGQAVDDAQRFGAAGLGVIPLGAEVRAFVDALGQLNQAVAARCQRVTLMAAGLPLTLKDAAP